MLSRRSTARDLAVNDVLENMRDGRALVSITIESKTRDAPSVVVLDTYA